MADINYEILGRKVSELYPEIAKELIKSPQLCDISLIEEIHDHHFSENQSAKSKLIFIAVILQLYDPDVISGWKMLCKSSGIRSKLAILLNVSCPQISNHIQTVRNYYTIYRKFKTEVDYFSDLITKQYQEHGR